MSVATPSEDIRPPLRRNPASSLDRHATSTHRGQTDRAAWDAAPHRSCHAVVSRAMTPPHSDEYLNFVGAAGGPLSARIRRPEGAARGSVLMAHCFTCSKDLHTTTRLTKAFAAAGWITFSFDFTGLGESEGSFAETSVSTNVGDLRRGAVAMLEQRIGPCLLLGHSLRRYCGDPRCRLTAHGRRRDLRGVAGRRATHPDTSFPTTPIRPPNGFRSASAVDRSSLRRSFSLTSMNTTVIQAARGLDRPVLVVEAGADAIVGPDQTGALAAAADAEIAVIEGADHLFTAADHARELADIVVEWASRDRTR